MSRYNICICILERREYIARNILGNAYANACMCRARYEYSGNPLYIWSHAKMDYEV
jgi:hypothetical protein